MVCHLSSQGLKLWDYRNIHSLLSWNVALGNPHITLKMCLSTLARKWGWTPGSDVAHVKQTLTWATCHSNHPAVKCWNLWEVSGFKRWKDSGRNPSYLHHKFFSFQLMGVDYSSLIMLKRRHFTDFPHSIFITFLCQPWRMRCGTGYISKYSFSN